MKRLILAIWVFLTLVLLPLRSQAVQTVRHDLQIVLYPEEHRFTAKDLITLPEESLPKSQFVLHSGLQPTSSTPGVRLVRQEWESGSVPQELFTVILPTGQSTFILEYGGGHGEDRF